MKALISPNEPVSTGYRVAEVTETEFEVAQPLFWVECDSTVIANMYFYEDGVFKEAPIPLGSVPEVALQIQPITQGAQTL
jgi:hypothetical protein